MTTPSLYGFGDFMPEDHWLEAEQVLNSPGWYYGDWTGESTGQWIRYLDDNEFFAGKFTQLVNEKLKSYNLQVNTGYPKNIRANSTGYGIGGTEHADWLGDGKEDWYTLLWYTNRKYEPSWGGNFYFYNKQNKLSHITPWPNTVLFFHGHLKHSWLPYLNPMGQRVNVTLSLRTIK